MKNLDSEDEARTYVRHPINISSSSIVQLVRFFSLLFTSILCIRKSILQSVMHSIFPLGISVFSAFFPFYGSVHKLLGDDKVGIKIPYYLPTQKKSTKTWIYHQL